MCLKAIRFECCEKVYCSSLKGDEEKTLIHVLTRRHADSLLEVVDRKKLPQLRIPLEVALRNQTHGHQIMNLMPSVQKFDFVQSHYNLVLGNVKRGDR